MKKNRWFGLALVATMFGVSFSACSNEAEEVLAQESEIKLTSEITPSRVTSLDYQSTQIAENQEIGVTITGSKSGNDYVNKLWISNGEGGLSTTQTVYWANTDIDVIAYHPFNEEWTSGTKTFTVSNDQSDENNYLNSDLLFATRTDVGKTENAISLTFSHKLAKINVTLQPEYQEVDLSNAVISICNTKTSTTIDLSNGTVPVEATGNIAEIKAGTGLTASAIVVPQTVALGTQFIKVVLGSKTFYYILPANKQLKSGYSHNYTLTVKETALEIASSSEIDDWEDENGNTGDAMEEARTIPNDEIWYTTKDGQALTFNNAFDVEIESNTYNNGQGVIKFNSDITIIKNDAFKEKNLTSITLPNSVKTIESFAFSSCSYLTSITIPQSVTSISNNPFMGCSSLASIIVEEDNSVYNSRNGCNAIIETATNTLLTGCKNTVIPDGIVTIGIQAFTACSSLENITIPNSVESILPVAFGNCTSLATVNVDAITPPTLGADVFTLAPQSLIIYVPANSVEAYKEANGWSSLNIVAKQ